ncbi:MAG: hypothetical protein ACRDJX_05170 [Solirubrobacteraceae bacterium]
MRRKPERLDEFFCRGIWLNVAAAIGIDEVSAGGEWVRSQLGSA